VTDFNKTTFLHYHELSLFRRL